MLVVSEIENRTTVNMSTRVRMSATVQGARHPQRADRGPPLGALALVQHVIGQQRQISIYLMVAFARQKLLANKPSGRQIACEEDELWPWRALLAASANRCSSWRSAASARGSR